MNPVSRLRWPANARVGRCCGLRAVSTVCLAALALLQTAPAWAQPEGGTTIVVSQRTPYVESVVVVALCGAALFAVCRSSRRN